MARSALEKAVRTKLEPVTEKELAELALAERRAEVFLLCSTGVKQSDIARRMGVSQATVSYDYNQEIKRRRSRGGQIEDELERIAGMVEAVAVTAWKRHQEAVDQNPGSVAGATYLKLVLESAEQYARLRGLDGPHGTSAPKGHARVVVQIGGTNEQPAISVGLEAEAS